MPTQIIRRVIFALLYVILRPFLQIIQTNSIAMGIYRSCRLKRVGGRFMREDFAHILSLLRCFDCNAKYVGLGSTARRCH